MKQIEISLIRPSPNPIRKSWDEDKMNELAASIKERGIIVPIKVRPIGDEYEIVYGHRRVEASRRAGLAEMPVIVEEADDTDALIQALIENLQREDMNPVDVAYGLKALMDATGSNTRDIERMGLMVHSRVNSFLGLLNETDTVQSIIGTHKGGGKVTHKLIGLAETDLIMSDADMPVTVTHATYVRNAGVKTPEEREAILLKASREGLSYLDARAVADAYVKADTPELREAVLDTSGKLGDGDRILQVAQMKIGAQTLTDRKEQERQQAFEEYDQAVKDFLDSVKLFDRMIKTAQSAARYGKFSPEGARFALGRINSLINELTALKEALSNVQ